MRGYRAKLRPVQRRHRKTGALQWFARGFVPVRLADGTSKTGDPVLVELLPAVASAIAALPAKRAWLFGYGPGSASSVRREIERACRNAGVPYYSPHKFGRHAFATRLLRAGKSTELVRRAGGWATIEMVSRRYGHLAREEVTSAVHDAAGRLLDRGGKAGLPHPDDVPPND